MSYNVKLHFTGLCVFTFEGGTPEEPDLCRVLLVNASRPFPYAKELGGDVQPHLHVPKLIIDPRHLRFFLSRRPDSSSESPSGQDFAVFDIAHEEVSLKSSQNNSLNVKRGRKSGGNVITEPSSGQEGWFDWTMSIRDIAKMQGNAQLSRLKPECLGELHRNSPVIARVDFVDGRLESGLLSRTAGKYSLWQYKSLAEDESDEKAHVVAETVVLNLANIPDDEMVKFVTTSGDILVGPEGGAAPGSTVDVAITNLDDSSRLPRVVFADHFWYYTLFDWRVPTGVDHQILPWPGGDAGGAHTPSTGSCPPGSG